MIPISDPCLAQLARALRRFVLPAGCVLLLAAILPRLGEAQCGLTIPAGWMVVDAPWRPKDFAITKYNGMYHLFFIRHNNNLSMWDPQNEADLGHAVSPDLRHWTTLAPVLGAHSLPNADYDHIWAPSIIRKGTTYIMYFTGVLYDGFHTNGLQTIRYAISSNLASWTVFPDWISYGPGSVPWALQDPSAVNFGDFRDPSVIRDPHPTETGDPPGWLMYYVTHPSSEAIGEGIPGSTDTDPNHVSYVVGLAHADYGSELSPFDVKALWATHRAYPTGGHFNTIESPTVFSHQSGGATGWVMIAGAGGAYADNLVAWTAPDPTAEPADWTWKGSAANLGTGHPCGITSLTWFKDSYGNFDDLNGYAGAEYFLDDDGREYLCDFNYGVIETRQMKWTSLATFDLEQPLAFETLYLDAGNATNCTNVHITITGKNLADGLGTRFAYLEAVRVDEQGNELGTIPNDQVALPGQVQLTGDATTQSWHPTAVQGEASTRMVVRLRAPDTDIKSAPITVTATSCGGGGGPYRFPASAQPVSEARGGAFDFQVEAQSLDGRDARLRATLPAASTARVQVFDLHGRQVRLLSDGMLPAGESHLAWDRMDDAGQHVPPGVYFVRLATAFGMRSVRFVVVR